MHWFVDQEMEERLFFEAKEILLSQKLIIKKL